MQSRHRCLFTFHDESGEPRSLVYSGMSRHVIRPPTRTIESIARQCPAPYGRKRYVWLRIPGYDGSPLFRTEGDDKVLRRQLETLRYRRPLAAQGEAYASRATGSAGHPPDTKDVGAGTGEQIRDYGANGRDSTLPMARTDKPPYPSGVERVADRQERSTCRRRTSSLSRKKVTSDANILDTYRPPPHAELIE